MLEKHIDSEKYYLGRLCSRGHDYEGTGKTLRFLASKHCLKCSVIRTCKWEKANPERVSARSAAWIKKNPHKKYRAIHGDRARKHAVERYRSDVSYHMACNLKHRVRSAIKAVLCRKSATTVELLGCTIEELRAHLESLWKPGMSWENYGGRGTDCWVIDHKTPCCAFDLSLGSEQRRCFNYRNLQPLWHRENLDKARKDRLLKVG